MSNVLLTWDHVVKIADLGTAHNAHNHFCPSPITTAYVRAPECLAGSPQQGWEVDSWAVGVIACALFSGELLAIGAEDRQLAQQSEVRRWEDICAAFAAAVTLLEPITEDSWPQHSSLKSWPRLRAIYTEIAPRGTLQEFMAARLAISRA